MVITLRDVKVAYIQVNDFKNTNSFLPLQAATLTLEEIERIPEVMAARLQLNNQADSLFHRIASLTIRPSLTKQRRSYAPFLISLRATNFVTELSPK